MSATETQLSTEKVRKVSGVDKRNVDFLNSLVQTTNDTVDVSENNITAIANLSADTSILNEEVEVLTEMAWETVSGLSQLSATTDQRITELSGSTDQRIGELSATTDERIATLSGNVGQISALTTTAKTDIVSAANEINSRVNFIVPAAAPSEGQILTYGPNNKVIWKTPAISDIEDVTVQLSVSGGTGSVSGIAVTVDVEGGATSGFTTDNTGKCQFSIEAGAIYNVNCAGIEGYVTPAVVSCRSTLKTRTISIIYYEQTLMEHVIVSFWYDNIGTARANSLNVTALGTTTTYPITNNHCEFNIPLGATYTIQYEGATGYDTPASVTVAASNTSREITARYISTVNQLCWIKTDGSVVGFTDLSSLQENEVFGVRIQTSKLSGSLGGNCSYVIPYAYLIGESSVGQKSWGSAVQFNSIGNYTSETLALTDDGTNFDGQANTLAVKAEALNRGLSVPAFDAVQAISYTIGGVTRQCFLGSYVQIKAFGTNRNNINTIVNNAFGKTVININSGDWWCSTQYSADRAVRLNGGGFGSFTKTDNSISVVPFLAY